MLMTWIPPVLAPVDASTIIISFFQVLFVDVLLELGHLALTVYAELGGKEVDGQADGRRVPNRKCL